MKDHEQLQQLGQSEQPEPPKSLKGKEIAGKLAVIPEDLSSQVDLLCPSRCKTWLLDKLYQGKITCPHCGHQQDKDCTIKRFRQLKPAACDWCKRRIMAFGKDTIFSNIHYDPEEIVALLILLRAGAGKAVISQLIGMHPDTAGRWEDIFNEVRRHRQGAEKHE